MTLARAQEGSCYAGQGKFYKKKAMTQFRSFNYAQSRKKAKVEADCAKVQKKNGYEVMGLLES